MSNVEGEGPSARGAEVYTPPADGSPPPAAPAGDVPAAAQTGAWAWLKRHGKWLLLGAGVIAVSLLVYKTGARKVLDVLVGAGPLLPIIFFLEGLWISMDLFAIRSMLGEHGKKAPWSAYVRSELVAFPIMVFLPVGRPGGEIARATLLAPHVGSVRAGAAAARINGVSLFANALVSIPCFLVIAASFGLGDQLSIGTLLNAGGTAFLGLGILLVTRHAKVGGFLGKRFRSMVHWGPAFDEALREMPAVPYGAIGWCLLGRLIQTAQYALILHAVGGSLTWSLGFVSQGIHLVGAALGDVVPNQVGFHEGAFAFFAGKIGLADHPERALSIALIGRIGQFVIAALCLAATSLWKRTAPLTPRGSPSPRGTSDRPT